MAARAVVLLLARVATDCRYKCTCTYMYLVEHLSCASLHVVVDNTCTSLHVHVHVGWYMYMCTWLYYITVQLVQVHCVLQ